MDFLSFLNNSITPYHTIQNSVGMLLAQGFQKLSFQEAWHLEPSKSYFIKQGQTTLFAFRMPQKISPKLHFKLAMAHSDFPTLKVTPRSMLSKSGVQLVHSEVYGSPLYHSWLDRDLGCAGLIVFEKDGQIQNRLVQGLKKFNIPQLAVHLQRNVNQDGIKVDPQKGLDVFWSSNESDSLESWLQQELAPGEELLDFDIQFFDAQPASYGGANDEWIYSGRLDNLASCHAAMEALLQSPPASNSVFGACIFNHEEIGSETREGARGPFLKVVLGQILDSLRVSELGLHGVLENSFSISMDMAHALHPSYPEKYDDRHAPVLGGGIVLKQNAQKRYATDVFSSATFKRLCRNAGISFQDFVSRNDMPCGSTIGPAISASLGIPTVDVGEPMLSMHSIREMSASRDHLEMTRLITALFQEA